MKGIFRCGIYVVCSACIIVTVVFFSLLPSYAEINDRILSETNASEQVQSFKRKALNEHIQTVQQETIRLQAVMSEIETPMSGVEEIIRREKMRMLQERIDDNMVILSSLQKEEKRSKRAREQYNAFVQSKDIAQQQKIIAQQSKIPKP